MNVSSLTMRTNRLLVAASIFAAAFVFQAEVASAAEFQLLVDNSTESETPSDNTPPCLDDADADAEANDNGGVADVDADTVAQALGSDASCSQSAVASAKGAGLFQLVATMGEAPGEPVSVCVIARQAIEVEALGDATATQVSERIVASVVGGGLQVAIPKKSVKAEGGDDIVVEFECHRQFTMRIGEQLQLSAGGTSKATLNGIGGAEASGDYEVEAGAGTSCENGDVECEIVVDSPTFSPLAMTALGLLLPACGGLVLRRRRRRSTV